MERKKAVMILTSVGVVIIILVQTIISISSDKDDKEINFIKENLISFSKECIKSNKCNKGAVTVKMLKDNNYISGSLIDKLDSYSDESYVIYPNYEVKLIKKEGK